MAAEVAAKVATEAEAAAVGGVAWWRGASIYLSLQFTVNFIHQIAVSSACACACVIILW